MERNVECLGPHLGSSFWFIVSRYMVLGVYNVDSSTCDPVRSVSAPIVAHWLTAWRDDRLCYFLIPKIEAILGDQGLLPQDCCFAVRVASPRTDRMHAQERDQLLPHAPRGTTRLGELLARRRHNDSLTSYFRSYLTVYLMIALSFSTSAECA